MKRSRLFAAVTVLATLSQLLACSKGATEQPVAEKASSTATNQITSASSPAADPPEEEETPAPAPARGFGTITGRRPGTSTVVSGVRLATHDVRVTIRDGYARTEIEEEFANDTDQVLEGRYVFPLPSGSSLSKLGLWVENELVIGEMVERDRAARIFQGIVDDTVRPRDPALLEWAGGSKFSLKIFPMPAKKTRKVLIAYDEVLPVVGGRARYTYPLSLGPDRAIKMDSFRLQVTAEDAGATGGEAKITGHEASMRTEKGILTADFNAKDFVPEGDFVLDYPRPKNDKAPIAIERVGEQGGYFALRLPVPMPAEQQAISSRNEKVIVLDASHGMTEAGYAAEVAVAKEVLKGLGAEDKFAVMLCDTACVTYPEKGLAANSRESIADARQFMSKHRIGGATDIANALTTALQRLPDADRGQVVYLGDGTPSAGELKVDSIVERVRPVLTEKRAELRLIGAGSSVDEVVLLGLAETLSASYERLSAGDGLNAAARAIAANLNKPLLTDAKIELPTGFVDVIPGVLPALRAGEEIVVVGKLKGATESESEQVKLTGRFGSENATWTKTLAFSSATADNKYMLARRWANARIEQLQRTKDDQIKREVIALSTKYHVMSRYTSLIVLENDRMFAAFGIPRTQGEGKLSSAAEMGSDSPFGEFTGLGLSGVGVGGGGRGEGLGIGSIGSGQSQGYGLGSGRLSGAHRAKPPQVRMGSTTVSGRLPPEVIQRIVRRNFGRFRICYEQGLARNPNLEGRVVVKFVIGRDGGVQNVANGGSNMSDGMVVSCVVRAFYGLNFPQPEGGIVTVTYPIMFSPGDSPVRSSQRSSGGSSWIAAADDAWRTQSADAIKELKKEVETSKESRRAREALINGLLVRGRFEDAYREASTYVSMDPDRVMPHELFARAAATSGNASEVLLALDAQVEIEPTGVDLHKRAARAFEAAGDEVRACAHWRALADMDANDDNVLTEAYRCRAKLFGEKDAVLAKIAATQKPGKRLSELKETLAKSAPIPEYDAGRHTGEGISVSISCAAGVEGCPRVFVLDPLSRIISPITPGPGRSAAGWASVPSPMDGTYRVLVTGGLPTAQGQVEVRLDNTVKKFDVKGGDGVRTTATVSVSYASL